MTLWGNAPVVQEIFFVLHISREFSRVKNPRPRDFLLVKHISLISISQFYLILDVYIQSLVYQQWRSWIYIFNPQIIYWLTVLNLCHVSHNHGGFNAFCLTHLRWSKFWQKPLATSVHKVICFLGHPLCRRIWIYQNELRFRIRHAT